MSNYEVDTINIILIIQVRKLRKEEVIFPGDTSSCALSLGVVSLSQQSRHNTSYLPYITQNCNETQGSEKRIVVLYL